MRVLIVEDSNADFELILRELERAFGVDVEAQRVDTLAKAEHVAENGLDVALVDLRLPAADGREVIKRLRAICPDLAIIAVTGSIEDHEAASLIVAGADDYLLKDRLARLGPAIARTLDTNRRQRRADDLIDGQSRVLTSIAMGAPTADTLDAIVRLIEAQAPGMLCSILLLEGNRVRHGAAPSLPDSWNQAVDGEPIGARAGSCGTAAFTGEDIVCVDIAVDPLWEKYRDGALAHGLRASWSRPIFGSDGVVLGTFAMYYRERRAPTAEERHLIEVAARLATVALEKSRTDASLLESRQRFRSLFSNNPVAVFLVGPDGRLQEANPAGESLLARRARVLKRLHLREFFDEADRAVVDAAFKTSMAGVSRSLEIDALRENGTRIRVVLTSIPVNVGDEVAGVYAVCRDVTEERALQARYSLAARALENAAEGVMIFDAEFRLLEANPAFVQILGWKTEEVLGRPPDFLDPEGAAADLARKIRRELESVGVWRGEYQWRRKNGETFPALISFSSVKDQHGHIEHFVGVFSDVGESRYVEERLAFLAQHDALTQLANREQFADRLQAAIGAARRAGTSVGVVMADLDDFKAVNDSLGHESGDLLLKAAAARLRDSIADDDLVARFGGDEFAVLLTGVESSHDCAARVSRLMECLREPFLIGEHELYVTASIGVSMYPQDGLVGAILLSNADIAMYRAKEQGPNAYQFFSAEMNTKALDDLLLINGLRTALDRGEFELYYQPRCNMRNGRTNGVEALIRWHHPERGMVSPGLFIPLAERSGLIDRIGEWALTAACRQGRVWNGNGHPDLRVAVNLSARQLQQPDFVERIKGLITESGVRPDRIELEITESMLMTDPEGAAAKIAELHDFGLSIALDDFGTGYSSLSYLKKFTIDELKIDMSFVRGLPGDEDDAAIVKAIVAVGKSLGMRIVAEGIETEEQREFLDGLGCDEAQGYLLGRPVPAGEVVFH